MSNPYPKTANPGPGWGYQTIAFFERILPDAVFHFLLSVGTAIGMLFMPAQRRYSRDYLRALSGKEPSTMDVFRHFMGFMESLVVKLRAGRGVLPKLAFSEASDGDGEAFEQLCRSPQQALFGTFHVGHSDMMGCMLRDFERSVAMVRLQVGNSADTEVMERTFGETMKILWINDPREFLFALKDGLIQGESIALQCDRAAYASRTAYFEFLGCQREFPMTIYYLSHMFKCPVVFAFTGPQTRGQPIPVTTSRVFYPAAKRTESLNLGKAHFQEVLTLLEQHLKQHPFLWFNFLPLNKPIDAPAAGHD